MQIERLDIAECTPDPANARAHSDKNLAAIKGSLVKFGQQTPIVVDHRGIVLKGNGTLAAAKELGWETIDVVRTDLVGTDATGYAIADNRTGELASWDDGALGKTLAALKADGFALDMIGFDDADLAKWLEPPAREPGLTDENEVPEQVPARTKPGDLWVLGEHRVLCGDATCAADVERLMAGEKADLVYTDPPYGIGHTGKFGVDGATKAGAYRPMQNDDSTATATAALALLRGIGATMIVWGANYFPSALADDCAWIVWDKQVIGDRFADCELAWLNKPGRVRRFVHQWHGMIKASERGEARQHPTQKPVALAEWCFTEYASDATLVLDTFLGSGSTLIACEKTGHRCYGMEIDPHYCDVVVERWEQFTGKKAELA